MALTGATGFIGTTLSRELRQRGLRVRALVRDARRADMLAAQGVELVTGDLSDRAALGRLVEDAAAVVHAAGAVRGACAADFDRVNVAGTEAVCAALAAAAPQARLLLVSSLAAREPQLSWYAHSKRAAEEVVHSAPVQDWVIVRPPAVYGPGDREMLPVFNAMRRGWAPVPGACEARFSLVYVDDLCRALADCLASPAAAGGTFTPCDGHPGGYDWREACAIAAEVFKRPVRPLVVPAPLLNAVAATNLGLARLRGSLPMLTPPKLRELRHTDWTADNAGLTEVTGWRPAIDLRAGLEILFGEAA
ncbi:NAD-dependent epimerase/dehydratase family protein [Mangrovimicrobium sediminis]|uniref:NAD-dependent epimerase/dehydratase family protein n=1 Tax=Mangrovimicrobium sediminis TaxID=2562682 RepID=UPI0019826FAA|nr:NAD-dependent epimerase/dehydratase family protein [Haliea sp. SAOS-164]